MNKKKYKRKKHTKKYVEWIERDNNPVINKKDNKNPVESQQDPFATLKIQVTSETSTTIASLEAKEEIKEVVANTNEELKNNEPKKTKKVKPGLIAFWAVLIIVDILIAFIFISAFNGWKRTKDDSGFYYFKGGNPVTGFYTIDEKEYFFNEQNIMVEGWVVNNDLYYYQTKDEGLYKSEMQIDGMNYNFCPDGHLMRGIEEVDGIKYIYDEYGYLVEGLYTLDDHTYLADKDGKMMSGFNFYNGKRYYFDPETGYMCTGGQVINGDTYLFDEEGAMQTGFIEYEDTLHFFQTGSGKMVYDTLMKFEGYYYRLDENGTVITGFYEEDGNTYYFYEDGKMLIGWMSLADGYQYYDETGARVYGWYDIEADSYYFDEETGYMYNAGKMIQNDKEYYFFGDGKAAKGFTTIDGKCYYYNVEHAKFKRTGFNLIEGKKYYFNDDYSIVFGWQTFDGYKYYFDVNGVMCTGMRTIGGNQYYFYNDGKMAVSTKIDKFVIDENGIVTDPFKTITADNLDSYIEQLLKTKGSDLNSIYQYCKSFRYKYRPKADITTMACRMLNNGSGACWDYAALCYKMMRAAGYNCQIVIGKGAVYSEHNWLLVETSPGVWRHVDPERQGYNIFLLTDAELEAYDGIRSNVRYQWDHSAYPAAK